MKWTSIFSRSSNSLLELQFGEVNMSTDLVTVQAKFKTTTLKHQVFVRSIHRVEINIQGQYAKK